MRDRSYDDMMAEIYLKTPADAIQLIDAVLEDGDALELLVTLRQMVHTMGGVEAACGATGASPEALSAMLTNQDAPLRNSVADLLRSTRMFFAQRERVKRETSVERQATSRVA